MCRVQQRAACSQSVSVQQDLFYLNDSRSRVCPALVGSLAPTHPPSRLLSSNATILFYSPLDWLSECLTAYSHSRDGHTHTKYAHSFTLKNFISSTWEVLPRPCIILFKYSNKKQSANSKSCGFPYPKTSTQKSLIKMRSARLSQTCAAHFQIKRSR